MKKPELIDAIAAKTELTKNDTTKFLDGFINVILDTMIDGEEIDIYGFAKFIVVDQPERMGRNPKTGETKMVPAKKNPKVKLSNVVKKAVNV